MPLCEPAEPAWEALCLLQPRCMPCSSLLGWWQLKSSFRSALPCDVTPWLDLNLITEARGSASCRLRGWPRILGDKHRWLGCAGRQRLGLG